MTGALLCASSCFGQLNSKSTPALRGPGRQDGQNRGGLDGGFGTGLRLEGGSQIC